MKSRWFINRENEILKRLLKDGFCYINYSSTDCDGCTCETSFKVYSLEELYTREDDTAESTDGSFAYYVATQYTDGSHDLNEDYCGGQWSAF